MKKVLLLFLLSIHAGVWSQGDMNKVFEKTRNNMAELTAFMTAMPKGGDIHHHFDGSLYAENLVSAARANGFWVNTHTLDIAKNKPKQGDGWILLRDVNDPQTYAGIREKMIQKWSVQDFVPGQSPAHTHAFATFWHFAPVIPYYQLDGLRELQSRAKSEKVCYIESIYLPVSCAYMPEDTDYYNDLFSLVPREADSVLQQVFKAFYSSIDHVLLKKCVQYYVDSIVTAPHEQLKIDDEDFVMRYQAYVLRFKQPAELFFDMLMAFEAASMSHLITGVNIVAPEYGQVAIASYDLHMNMLRYFKQLYPDVKLAAHAGELVSGLVAPEHLMHHISDAVYIAGADRIGHGVSLPRESDVKGLLEYMHANGIAIEINLTSNEYILGVKGDQHPVMMYVGAGVPVVIASDDPGVFRTSLTDQYILLAYRYPEISYFQIKQMVYNSIKYSFIESNELKSKLIRKLDYDFSQFEHKILATNK